MGLLKKFFSDCDEKLLFPQSTKATLTKASVDESNSSATQTVRLLLENTEFIQLVYKHVAEKILYTLCEQYDFTPTDKYLEIVANRKKYIEQLDNYLLERKDINNNVENELQLFLQETTTNLSKALDTFTQSIQKRITQAESRHGIDNIKDALLSTTDKPRVAQ